jgi:hypothetical protein
VELRQSLESEMSRAVASVVLTPSIAEGSCADGSSCCAEPEPQAHVPGDNARGALHGAVKRAGQSGSLRNFGGGGCGLDESRQRHGLESMQGLASMLDEFDALLGISNSDTHEVKQRERTSVPQDCVPQENSQSRLPELPHMGAQSTSIAGFASFRCTPICGAPYPPSDACCEGLDLSDLSWSHDDELPTQEGV